MSLLKCKLSASQVPVRKGGAGFYTEGESSMLFTASPSSMQEWVLLLESVQIKASLEQNLLCRSGREINCGAQEVDGSFNFPPEYCRC